MAHLKRIRRPSISKAEGHTVLSWLFSVSIKSKDLTDADVCFAEALLVELLNSSFAMGFIEAIFRASAGIPSGPKKVIVSFLKGAGKNLLTYKDKDDLSKMIEDPKIYKSVKDKLSVNYRSVWGIREATGELTY